MFDRNSLDDFIEYLIVTDQVDENLNLKEEKKDDENLDDDDEKNIRVKKNTKRFR